MFPRRPAQNRGASVAPRRRPRRFDARMAQRRGLSEANWLRFAIHPCLAVAVVGRVPPRGEPSCAYCSRGADPAKPEPSLPGSESHSRTRTFHSQTPSRRVPDAPKRPERTQTNPTQKMGRIFHNLFSLNNVTGHSLSRNGGFVWQNRVCEKRPRRAQSQTLFCRPCLSVAAVYPDRLVGVYDRRKATPSCPNREP
jgi:hypothetical protein